jgi:hypothetical protein
MRVGIGPPAPCVMEYIFQPLPMVAVTLAVPRPPEETFAGETLIESETGPWAAVVRTHTKTVRAVSKQVENVDLKIRIGRRTEQLPLSQFYMPAKHLAMRYLYEKYFIDVSMQFAGKAVCLALELS